MFITFKKKKKTVSLTLRIKGFYKKLLMNYNIFRRLFRTRKCLRKSQKNNNNTQERHYIFRIELCI